MEKKKNFSSTATPSLTTLPACRCKRTPKQRKNSQKETAVKPAKHNKPQYRTQQTCPSENEQSAGSTHYTQWFRSSQSGSNFQNPVPYWKEMSRQLATMAEELDEENVRLCSTIQKFKKETPKEARE